MIGRATPALLIAALILAPLSAAPAELGPLAAGGAAGVRQAQAEDSTPGFWLAGAGAVVALIAIAVMNNNGGAVVSGTLALAGNAPAQGANIPGAPSGASNAAGSMSGGNQ